MTVARPAASAPKGHDHNVKDPMTTSIGSQLQWRSTSLAASGWFERKAATATSRST